MHSIYAVFCGLLCALFLMGGAGIAVGDATYGPEDGVEARMMLHAWKLWLPFHPRSKCSFKAPVEFTSPDPFTEILQAAPHEPGCPAT